MLIKQMFTKDIHRPINGVVKADQTGPETVFLELDEYVVTKELGLHFESFFETYMPSVRDPKAKAQSGKLGVWVSGFFGSGKSHFIKILSYLLQNLKTEKGAEQKNAVQFFREKLTDAFLLGEIEQAVSKDNTVILFNIDSRANTDDKEDAILKVFLKVFNETMGFSGDHPHIAHLERDLTGRGLFEAFKTEFQSITSADWLVERDAYDFYRDDMAQALANVTKQSIESSRQWVEQLEKNFSLDVANFCKWVKEYLDVDQNRRVLFFVDEVGQFIGSNTKMMLKLQTITENLGTICEGRAWVVVTSQEDIDSVLGQMKASSQDFSKIQGRFERISLSSSNTNEVIEKRLLEKNAQARQELAALFDAKGDIIRNQLSFDQTTTAELGNYSDVTSFVHSYPFVPYHYTLVQKIFEAIRRAGATGLHLSRGERSLLDAFQTATKHVADQHIGVLIPLYAFYPAIESFLDTSVKRDINQAADKNSISDFAVDILKTLFLIRYVEVIKSTLDNLVTLCVSEIDQDRLALRRQIEQALIVLEQNLLIARQGDEYIFLTNEEKEIENEIKNTEIESTEESVQLGNLIFDDILRRTSSYRYPDNKQDFPISRFCNGIPKDNAQENDLVLRIVAPIDSSYDDYDKNYCLNLSQTNNGCILVRLTQHPRLYHELRTYIKTGKFIRVVGGNRPEQERLLRDKAAENNARLKRITSTLEEMMKEASFYALGSELNPKGGAISSMLDEAYRYVIENTFSKLKLVKPFAGDIRREIQSVLLADDVAQIGFDLGDPLANPQACLEIERFISLNDDLGRPVTAEDIVKQFSRRPYGWNDDEIILLLARLGLANKVIFQARQQDVPLKQLYDQLTQVRRRADLRIRRVKQQSEANLKKAMKIFRDLFNVNAGDNEKQLYDDALQRISQWNKKLVEFKAKASTGSYPGKADIDNGISLFASLLGCNNSYQFIDQLISNENDLLDFEEDYQDLENFYETQFGTWQKLRHALDVKFERNRHALEKDEQAILALGKLRDIAANTRPYAAIREIDPLINQLSQINDQLIAAKAEHARGRIDVRLKRVQEHLKEADATAELSNKALYPFQQALLRIEKSISIAEIHQEITDAETWEDDAEQLINRFIEQRNKQTKPTAPPTTTAPTEPAVEPAPAPAPSVKKVQAVEPVRIVHKVNGSGYLETTADVEKYLSLLRQELMQLIDDNHKVRIR